MTDLTTLTDDQLEAENTQRFLRYVKTFYTLTASIIADVDRYPNALNPGGVKLTVHPSYNEDLTEASLTATAYVERRDGEEYVWQRFFSINQIDVSEDEIREQAHEAVSTFRSQVEIARELQRRDRIRQAEALALISIDIDIPEEYL